MTISRAKTLEEKTEEMRNVRPPVRTSQICYQSNLAAAPIRKQNGGPSSTGLKIVV